MRIQNSIVHLVVLLLTIFFASTTPTVAEDDNSRNLKKSGGGGGGGYRPKGTTSGGGSSGGGGGAVTPTGGNYLNGGLGDNYRSGNPVSQRNQGAEGSCCAYLCCSAGYTPGYRRYWYNGYRPTESEGKRFEGACGNVSATIEHLLQLNETTNTYTGDCAYVQELDGMLVNRTDASQEALANFTNMTVHSQLSDLSDRMDSFRWGTETDLREDIRDWFLDYHSLQPCFDELSEVSTLHESRVLEVRQEVEAAEDVANSWESRLASGSRMWGGLSSVLILATVGVSFILV